MRRPWPSLLLLAAELCFVLPGMAQGVRVRGQIYLPTGKPIGEVTRFGLSSEDMRIGVRYEFTDSQGRFTLQSLSPDTYYTLTVESDERTYATTTVSFLATLHLYLPIHLNPLPKPASTATEPTVSTSALAHQPSKEAVELFKEGHAAREKKQFEKAADKFRRAIELDPLYVEAYNDLAGLEMDKKNYAQAESLLRQALEKDSNSPTVLLNLGISLTYLGRYAEAIEPLRRALRLRPQWLAPDAYLGLALLETDQIAEAEQHLVRATAAGSREEAIAYLYLGKLYAQSGEVEKAVSAWNQYLEKDPNSPNASRVRALLAQLGHPPQKP